MMCFHYARYESRLTAEGEIILLAYQNRQKWDKELIMLGNYYMNKAAFGSELSSYHIEAAIAYEHCSAKNFADTNWIRILQLYEWLCKASSSPVTELNRTVAVMEV